jgi:anti-anti-sigma factor
MTDLLLQIRPAADRTRVLVIGALDHRTARQFHQRLSALLNAEGCPGVIILDLRCCTFADEEGLQALAATRVATRARGVELRLEALPPLIEDLICRAGV